MEKRTEHAEVLLTLAYAMKRKFAPILLHSGGKVLHTPSRELSVMLVKKQRHNSHVTNINSKPLYDRENNLLVKF